MAKRKIERFHWRWIISAVLLASLLACGGVYASVSVWPSIGAQAADTLRQLFGDEAVASLERVVFQVQDSLHWWEHRLSGKQPESPWSVQGDAAVPQSPPTATLAMANLKPSLTPQPTTAIDTNPEAEVTASLPPDPSATPTPLPTWGPANLAALGSLEGEGQWLPYIYAGPENQVVCEKTFLQPDPERSYAIAAVVAFDLSATRLNYVLGLEEPGSDVKVDRPGNIPAEDKRAGHLLAVFNGGFKGRHGKFGVMVNNTVVIPARATMGTVVLYQNGQVEIREWDASIESDPTVTAWRQNGPLILQNGQISQRIFSNSTNDWGSTVDGQGVVPTWRSALGISQDQKTLYYVAGPYLTVEALARVLATAGAYNAVQLDINNYWVHFGVVVPDGAGLNTIPLFKQMAENANRYLGVYARDFFYVTAK